MMLDTLARAKVEISQNVKVGVDCPCCGLFVKQYRRKLNATQSQSLIALYRLSRDNKEHHHITAIEPKKAGTGELSKLVYWGLVENKVNEETNKKCSGYWRITDKGRLFAQNKISLPKHCIIFNHELLALDDTETVTITESLGDKFDYPELMGWLI